LGDIFIIFSDIKRRRKKKGKEMTIYWRSKRAEKGILEEGRRKGSRGKGTKASGKN
jgi:hypothetical protein